MDTKSKNNATVIWSILAIGLALMSIGYCFSIILLTIESGWQKFIDLLNHVAQLFERSQHI